MKKNYYHTLTLNSMKYHLGLVIRMIELTELEKELLLIGFVKSDFFEQEEQSVIWADSFADMPNIKGKSISGVVSSLVKKGIMLSDGNSKESTICLTELGAKILKELRT